MAHVGVSTTPGSVLGLVLIKLRAEKGIKQADLAAAMNLSPSTLSRIEKGDSSLSIEQLKLASNALGVTPGLILETAEVGEKEALLKGLSGVGPKGIGLFCLAAASNLGLFGAAIAGAKAAVKGSEVSINGSTLDKLIGLSISNHLKQTETRN
jgi:transcriptional regulator with XRE-family HTH domain